jgi:hypothetical protein
MTPEIKALVEAATYALRHLPPSAVWDTDRNALGAALKPFEPKKQVYRLAWMQASHEDTPHLAVVNIINLDEAPTWTSFQCWHGDVFTVEVPE